MRIADKMAYEQVKTNVAKNRSQMSELQNQAASQKRINKPSDDPLAASRVLSHRADLEGNKQYSKSLSYAKSYLEFTDQSLGELSEILVRAKELALSQANDGSSNQESRRAIATELEQLHNHMVAIGNRRLGDRYIFGGYHTQNTPFDEKGAYAGDNGEMMIHIDKETFLPMNIPGSRVFLGQGVSPDGMVKVGPPQAKTIEEFDQRQQQENAPPPALTARGPASQQAEPEPPADSGVNLFHLLKGLDIALNTNDKAGVQDTLDELDVALDQVILARSQVGSRGIGARSIYADRRAPEGRQQGRDLGSRGRRHLRHRQRHQQNAKHFAGDA